MGLAEKKEIENIKTTQFDGLKKQINDAAGFDVPLEIDWNSMMVDGQAHNYAASIGPVYFESTVNAFKNIANDDMGKQALKEGLKKIVMHNGPDAGSYGKFSFEGGVLTINHSPVVNVGDVAGRTSEIQGLMESKL